MTLRRIVVLFASVAALVPFAQGCQAGGVGDPCTPEDEYQTTFSGFDAAELNIESRSFQCETRVCLVNHFRGRVSCPLGMNEDVLSGLLNYQAQKNGTAFPAPGLQCPQDASGKAHGTMTAQGCVIAPDDPAVCRIPGESGKNAQTVQVTVNPQCTGAGTTDRTAGNAVYCSCRCAGDDPNANYCTCPSGYTCTELK